MVLIVPCAGSAEGEAVVASNSKLQLAAQDGAGLSSRRAILSQGGPPEGAVRMRSVSAQQRSSVIGRGRGGS